MNLAGAWLVKVFDLLFIMDDDDDDDDDFAFILILKKDSIRISLILTTECLVPLALPAPDERGWKVGNGEGGGGWPAEWPSHFPSSCGPLARRYVLRLDEMAYSRSRILSWVNFSPQRAFGNVWRHF